MGWPATSSKEKTIDELEKVVVAVSMSEGFTFWTTKVWVSNWKLLMGGLTAEEIPEFGPYSQQVGPYKCTNPECHWVQECHYVSPEKCDRCKSFDACYTVLKKCGEK